jgi:hypothetical protein
VAVFENEDCIGLAGDRRGGWIGGGIVVRLRWWIGPWDARFRPLRYEVVPIVTRATAIENCRAALIFIGIIGLRRIGWRLVVTVRTHRRVVRNEIRVSDDFAVMMV